MQQSVKYGLVGGLVICILNYLMFVNWPDGFFGLMQGIYPTLILVTVMILTASKVRKVGKGFADFQTLLKNVFVCYLIGSSIYAVFFFMMYNVIEPDLPKIEKQHRLEQVEKNKTLIRLEDYEEEMKIYEEMDYEQKVLPALNNYIRYKILGGFLLAALISFLFKREEPVYE